MCEPQTNGRPIRESSGPTFVLAALVLTFALINAVGSCIPDDRHGVFGIFRLGFAVFEPMLFGLWTALGIGSILTRLPIAAASLMFVFVAPGFLSTGFASIRREEFIVAILVGYAIYTAVLILALIFRWLTRLTIQSQGQQSLVRKGPVQFSTKYLPALITVSALGIGVTAQLKFDTSPPPLFLELFFGPDFALRVIMFGGAVISIALLPLLAIPLSILGNRPPGMAVKSAVAIWALVTLLLTVFLVKVEGDSVLESLGVLLLVQSSAALAGVLAALPSRWAGLRLNRPIRAEAEESRSAIQMPMG